jgi:hypothetical protein
MTFEIIDGRPTGTQQTDQGVIHCTCNPPSEETLNMHRIIQLGEKFGIGANEVLLIPNQLYEEFGKQVSIIETENMLIKLKHR